MPFSPRQRKYTAWSVYLWRTHYLFWTLAAFILVFNFSGCGEPKIADANTAKLGDSEVNLKFVMERLERALDLHQTSSEAGLRIKRQMSYQFQESKSADTPDAALVKVNTTTIFRHKLAPQKNLETSPKFDEEQAAYSRSLNQLSNPERSELEEFINIDPEDTAVKKFLKSNPTRDAHVEPRRLQETLTFKLVYKQDKWQLEQQPESELHRSWFSYALED